MNRLLEHTDFYNIADLQEELGVPLSGRMDEATVAALDGYIMQAGFHQSGYIKEKLQDYPDEMDVMPVIRDCAVKKILTSLYEEDMQKIARFFEACAKKKGHDDVRIEFVGATPVYEQGGVIKFQKGDVFRQTAGSAGGPFTLTKREIMEVADTFGGRAKRKLLRSKSFGEAGMDTEFTFNPSSGTFTVQDGREVGLSVGQGQVRVNDLFTGQNKASKAFGTMMGALERKAGNRGVPGPGPGKGTGTDAGGDDLLEKYEEALRRIEALENAGTVPEETEVGAPVEEKKKTTPAGGGKVNLEENKQKQQALINQYNTFRRNFYGVPGQAPGLNQAQVTPEMASYAQQLNEAFEAFSQYGDQGVDGYFGEKSRALEALLKQQPVLPKAERETLTPPAKTEVTGAVEGTPAEEGTGEESRTPVAAALRAGQQVMQYAPFPGAADPLDWLADMIEGKTPTFVPFFGDRETGNIGAARTVDIGAGIAAGNAAAGLGKTALPGAAQPLKALKEGLAYGAGNVRSAPRVFKLFKARYQNAINRGLDKKSALREAKSKMTKLERDILIDAGAFTGLNAAGAGIPLLYYKTRWEEEGADSKKQGGNLPALQSALLKYKHGGTMRPNNKKKSTSRVPYLIR